MAATYSPKAISLAKYFVDSTDVDNLHYSDVLLSQIEHRLTLTDFWGIAPGSRVLEIGWVRAIVLSSWLIWLRRMGLLMLLIRGRRIMVGFNAFLCFVVPLVSSPSTVRTCCSSDKTTFLRRQGLFILRFH